MLYGSPLSQFSLKIILWCSRICNETALRWSPRLVKERKVGEGFSWIPDRLEAKKMNEQATKLKECDASYNDVGQLCEVSRVGKHA